MGCYTGTKMNPTPETQTPKNPRRDSARARSPL